MNRNSYSHILKYTGLFGGVQGLNILIGLVRNKLVALLLGPQGMGLISLFNSTIGLLASATNLGIATSGVKDISEAYEKGDRQVLNRHIMVVRSWCLATAVLGFVACLLLSPLLDRWTFSWGNHTLHFMLLSPVVALMAITGGETAILKGVRQLRKLAVVSVANVVCVLLVTVPIYYFFGEAGIVPSLFLAALSQMLITVSFSYRLYPLRLSGGRWLLVEGTPMMRLGVALVLGAVFGSGAEFLIRSYLNNVTSLEAVGLYNSGYMLVVTYGGMIFSAMDTDYYPRLSAAAADVPAFHETANRQIVASVLLISPMLVMASFLMPVIIPLLFSAKFAAVITMAQVGVLSLFFRAVYLPLAYMNLARSNSLAFLALEAFSAVVLVASVLVGYSCYGLTGIGYAMCVAGALDLMVTAGYAFCKYHYRMTTEVVASLLLLLPVLVLTGWAVTAAASPYAYWLSFLLLTLASVGISVFFLLKSR